MRRLSSGDTLMTTRRAPVGDAANYEELVLGDLVRLKIGSPIGMVEAVSDKEVLVAWLTINRHYSIVSPGCLKTESLG